MGRLDKLCIFSNHVMDRMRERKISKPDVKTALKNGTIIELCEESKPHKRCLVLGYLENGTPLHVVVAFVPDGLLILTTYEPTTDRWSSDFKTKVVNKRGM